MKLYHHEPIIDDANYEDYQLAPVIDGELRSKGMDATLWQQRDAVQSYSAIKPFGIELFPRSEWSQRIKQMEDSRMRLSDIRLIANHGRPIPSTDQNGKGYCWAHSPVSAAMISRAVEGQPYVRLSAYSIACKIKGFRDQGGWNPEAAQFLYEHGVASVETWPEKSMNRGNDNANTWAEASLYRCTEGFWDIRQSKYDRNLTFDQLMTCLLLNIPCPCDFSWWGHSVCALDPVEVNDGYPVNDVRRWGVRIWNSWGDNWGALGMGVLAGNKAVPDGATAIKSMRLT